MDDDAVSPVIAVMLILALVITFFSLFNATVIPQMKEEAEVEHLQQVEGAFLQFASDIETAIALKRNMSLSERIQLGGGDILLNTVRSGGSLTVQQESPILDLSWDGGEPLSTGMVTLSYHPVSNFWLDQGYSWQYGDVHVTRGNDRTTSVLHCTVEDMERARESFVQSLVTIENDTTTGHYIIVLGQLIPGDRIYASGNGYASLQLREEVSYQTVASPVLTLRPGQFQDSLWASILPNCSSPCVPDETNRSISIPSAVLEHVAISISTA